MKLKFYGHSDDVFVEQATQQETYDLGDGTCAFKVCDNRAPEPGRGLNVQICYVVGRYAAGDLAGCWTIGLCQFDEDVALPDWPMKWGHEGYSVVLEIEVPEGTTVAPMVQPPE